MSIRIRVKSAIVLNVMIFNLKDGIEATFWTMVWRHRIHVNIHFKRILIINLNYNLALSVVSEEITLTVTST